MKGDVGAGATGPGAGGVGAGKIAGAPISWGVCEVRAGATSSARSACWPR